jgi:putative chitobiose transport system permease protein
MTAMLNRNRAHHPLTPYLFLFPAVAILGLFIAVGFLQVAAYSFTRYSAFTPPEFVGLDNYRELLASGVFLACLLNSFLYLAVTPAIVLISLLAAMVVASGVRGTSWYRLAFFLPVITPTIVAALAWRVLYDENSGLLNAALASLGLDPVRWLSERPWTLVAAMLVTLWKGFGFYMMVLLAALLAVPRELKEAAAIDGASRWGVFRHVVLPSIWPALALVAIVSSIAALKVFDEIFVTVKGTPITHQTVVPLIYQLAFERGRFGTAAAAGMLLFAVILALSLLNLRLSSRREAA